jgi:hypothetical protein
VYSIAPSGSANRDPSSAIGYLRRMQLGQKRDKPCGAASRKTGEAHMTAIPTESGICETGRNAQK